MKLYLVRHGETQMNVDRLYYGWTDCPLNPNGEEQAERLKQYFKNISIDRIITSDLLRAVSTAEKINEEKKLLLEKEKDFRELNFGEWEGKDFKYVKQEYPSEFKQWATDWKGFTIPKGETFTEFYRRVTEKLKYYIEEAKEDSSILILSHSGVMSAMMCYFTGAGPDSFWRFASAHQAYSLVSIRKGNIVIEKVNCPLF